MYRPGLNLLRFAEEIQIPISEVVIACERYLSITERDGKARASMIVFRSERSKIMQWFGV